MAIVSLAKQFSPRQKVKIPNLSIDQSSPRGMKSKGGGFKHHAR